MEEKKTIAWSFMEHGINYQQIMEVIPGIESKKYRCIVEAINNDAINALVDFLRKEHKMKVDKINRDQKRSIRTQLTKIKEWLGVKSSAQLETFYQYIRKQFDPRIQPPKDLSLQLYKTLIDIVKGRHVNVLKVEPAKVSKESILAEEDEAMLIEYIHWKDVQKVSDRMGQRYGYGLKWSTRAISLKLKTLLTDSVLKISSTLEEADQELYSVYFKS